MKKIITTLLASILVFSASAQNMYDALLYSQNNYVGSARSLSMGNAVTALGGDLGSIGINPAGSAVANYSQFVISPGVNISVATAQGTSLDGRSSPFCFDRKATSNRATFALPNIGANVNFRLRNQRGLKSWSFGFVANTTNSYDDQTYAFGAHGLSSIAGSFADCAQGINWENLDDKNAYNYCNNWDAVMAYKSGMIAPRGDYDDSYIGATEKYTGDDEIYTAGMLDQTFGRTVRGYKTDFIINAGFNISDKLFLGANLGITSIDYRYYLYFKEVAQNVEDFKIEWYDGSYTYFDNLRYQYNYFAKGSGVYGKFGAIYVPNKYIRLGAAIQTPTALRMEELWRSSAECYFTDSQYSGDSKTPDGNYTYTISSPARYNFGVAVNYGMGVVSVDYELVDYRTMRFKSYDYDDVNQDIRSYMGASHNLRAGVEFKPIAQMGIRAGYGLTTSGERDELRNVIKYYDHSFSFGLGYSSNRSFFADIAVRALKYHDEYIYPYYEYCDNTPEILNKRWLFNTVCTIGFRF